MTYEKYIKKNGKTYGPYLYRSRRVDDKVISEYYGPQKKRDYRKIIIPLFFILVIFLAVYGLSHLKPYLSGKAIFNLDAEYREGQPLDGVLELSMKQGEMIPSSAKLVFNNNGEVREYPLKEFVSEEEIVEGNFYVQGKEISGMGEGYGLAGERVVYPAVYFSLNILSSNVSEVSSGGGEEEEQSEEPTTETPSELPTEIPITETPTETPSELPTEIPEQEIPTTETSITPPTETPTETATESSPETSTQSASQETPSTSVSESSAQSSSAESPTSEKKSDEKKSSTESSAQESSAQSSSAESSTSEKKSDEKKSSDKGESGKKESSASESSASESSSESSAPSITGNIVSAFLKGISNFFLGLTGTGKVTLNLEKSVDANVSSIEQFVYNLKEGESVELKQGSVYVLDSDGKMQKIEDSFVNLDLITGKAIVSTDYSEIAQGFGEEYLGNEEKTLPINFSSLNLIFEKGNLSITLVYDNQDIVSINTALEEGRVKTNETLPEIPVLNETIILNQTNQTNQTFGMKFVSANNLSEEEKLALLEYFGNYSITTTKSEIFNERLIRNYKLGEYEVEYSYEYPGYIDSYLEEQMQKDLMKWLRDILREISKNETTPESVENLLGNYSFEENLSNGEEQIAENNTEPIVEVEVNNTENLIIGNISVA